MPGYTAEPSRPRTRSGVTSLEPGMRDAARALAEERQGVTCLRPAFTGSPCLHERLAWSRNAGAEAVGAREQATRSRHQAVVKSG
jgi:hypothetical protein